jgi:excisionase family DNA binding protein
METPMQDLATELERLLSVGEAAHLLGVKVSWVYGQAEAGRLPSFKLGKYRRFRPSELYAWLNQQRAAEGGR